MGVTSSKSECFPNWGYIFSLFSHADKPYQSLPVVYKDNCTIDINYVFKVYKLHILVIRSGNISCRNQYKCSFVSDCWMESLLKCLTTHIHQETLHRLATFTLPLKISAFLALHFQLQFTAAIVCSLIKIQTQHECCPLVPKYGVFSFLRLSLCCINWGIL